MKGLTALLVCQMAVASWASIFTGWWQEPYGDDSFNTQVEFGENATLHCENATEWMPLYWILPDTSVMLPGSSASVATFDGAATWHVTEDGRRMLMTGIDLLHFGFYYCVSNNTDGNLLVTKTAINYEGPYWGDLWAKYELATIIGLGCAGGFLLLATVFCVAYSCWCDPANDSDHITPLTAQANQAFTADDGFTVASKIPAYLGEDPQVVPNTKKYKMSKKEREFIAGQAAPYNEAMTPL